ncbi:MAG: NAD-dependent epimerase/dehydratase family protein [Bacteroidia bacterium]
MKNILITGVNGLIGETLAALLSQKGFNVTGAGRSDKKKVKTICIDFNSDWDTELLPKDSDVIIHLAQSEKFRDFPAAAKEIYNVNTNSTAKLLDHARKIGVKNFIYASSGGVYGTDDNAFTEKSPTASANTLGFYLSTKLMSEILVTNYHSFFHTNILRFFFVYGPSQRKDMLIPRLIESVKNGSTIKLQGEEGLVINPICVNDAAAYIEKLISFPGNNIFNVSGDEALSLKEICLQIGQHLNKTPVFENDLHTKPGNLTGSAAQINKITGGLKKTSFSEALKYFKQ